MTRSTTRGADTARAPPRRRAGCGSGCRSSISPACPRGGFSATPAISTGRRSPAASGWRAIRSRDDGDERLYPTVVALRAHYQPSLRRGARERRPHDQRRGRPLRRRLRARPRGRDDGGERGRVVAGAADDVRAARSGGDDADGAAGGAPRGPLGAGGGGAGARPAGPRRPARPAPRRLLRRPHADAGDAAPRSRSCASRRRTATTTAPASSTSPATRRSPTTPSATWCAASACARRIGRIATSPTRRDVFYYGNLPLGESLIATLVAFASRPGRRQDARAPDPRRRWTADRRRRHPARLHPRGARALRPGAPHRCPRCTSSSAGPTATNRAATRRRPSCASTWSRGGPTRSREFMDRSRTLLAIGSERVRAKYGYACSSALDQLRALEERAAAFASDQPVTVTAFE